MIPSASIWARKSAGSLPTPNNRRRKTAIPTVWTGAVGPRLIRGIAVRHEPTADDPSRLACRGRRRRLRRHVGGTLPGLGLAAHSRLVLVEPRARHWHQESGVGALLGWRVLRPRPSPTAAAGLAGGGRLAGAAQ